MQNRHINPETPTNNNGEFKLSPEVSKVLSSRATTWKEASRKMCALFMASAISNANLVDNKGLHVEDPGKLCRCLGPRCAYGWVWVKEPDTNNEKMVDVKDGNILPQNVNVALGCCRFTD